MTGWAALAFFLMPMLAGGALRLLRPSTARLQLLLSFSGAFLLTVVFLHMFPELYAAEGLSIGFWVLGGLLLQLVLEFFSRGLEHGHLHSPPHGGKTLPLVALLSLCIHSFVEGMPFADPLVATNLPFLAGVLLHKAPMGVALSTVLRRSGASEGRIWALLTVFALAAPLGVLAGHVGGAGLGEAFLHRVLGLAIGMLLHIGFVIIVESAPGHRFNAARFGAVLAGIALGALSVH